LTQNYSLNKESERENLEREKLGRLVGEERAIKFERD